MALGSSSGPVEAKVKVSTAAAAVSGVVLWALRTYAFHGALPPEVEVFVDVAVLGVATFAAGWAARHTPRGDPDAVAGGRHLRAEP